MLVIKRGLSFTLSFVLAYSPTLAFAKQKQSKERTSHFKAESVDQYNKDQELAEQRRAGKQAGKKSFAVKPAPKTVAKTSVPLKQVKQTKFKPTKHAKRTGLEQYKDMSEAVANGFHTIKSRGKSYQVYQSPGVNGKAKVQITQGEDFREILVDERGNGTASRWEITRGNTQFVAMNPYRGGFQNLEISEKRAGATVKARYSLNTDWKTYRLTKLQLIPYKMDGDKEVVHIGDATKVTNQCLIDNVKQVKSYIDEIQESTGKTAEAGLQCKLNRFKNFYIDPSCSTGKFGKGSDSSDDIAAGLAKVFASANTPDAKPPRYLQCLSNHDFAVHAATMQTNLNQYTQEKVVNQKVVTLGTPKEEAGKCETIQISDEQSKKLFPTTPKEDPPMFTCKLPKELEAEKGADIADYRSDGVSQIVFNENSKSTLKKLQKTTPGLTKASDAYAMLILHEMLHQSGIRSDDNESLVQDLEHCCAEPNSATDASNPACKRVDEYTAKQRQRQDHENDLDHYWPGYSQLRAAAENALSVGGSNAATDKFMGETFSELLGNRDIGSAYEDLKTCGQKPGADVVACQTKFNDSVGDNVRKIAKKNCDAVKDDVSSHKVNCGELATDIEQSLADGSKLIVQIQGGKNTSVLVDTPPRLQGDDELSNPLYRLAPVSIEVNDLPMPKIDYSQIGSGLPDLSQGPATGAPAKAGRNGKVAAAGTTTPRTTTGTTTSSTGTTTAAPTTDDVGPDIIVVGKRQPKTVATTGAPTVAPTTTPKTGTTVTPTTGVVSISGGLSEERNSPSTDPAAEPKDPNAQQATDPASAQTGVVPVATGTGVGMTGAVSKTAQTSAGTAYSSKTMSNFLDGSVPSTAANRYADSMQGAATAQALSNSAQTIMNGAAGYITNTASKLGIQAAVAQAAPAPQRAPASVTLTQAQANAGYRSMGSSSSSDEAPRASAASAKPAAERSNDESLSAGSRAAPVADLKTQAAAVERFESKQFRDSTDTVTSLIMLGRVTGSDTLASQLRNASSSIVQKLIANKWTVSYRAGVPILKDRFGKCYRTDPRSIIRQSTCE